MGWTGKYDAYTAEDYILQQAAAAFGTTPGNLMAQQYNQTDYSPNPYYGKSKAEIVADYTAKTNPRLTSSLANGGILGLMNPTAAPYNVPMSPTDWFNTWRADQVATRSAPHESYEGSGNYITDPEQYWTQGLPEMRGDGAVYVPQYQDPGDAEGLMVMAALTAGFGGLAAGAAAAGGAAGGLNAGAGLTEAGWGFGAGGLGGDAAGLAAGAGSTGGGMWDWIDELIGNAGDTGAENMFGFEGGSSLMPPAVPETAEQLTEWGLREVSPGNWSMPDMPGAPTLPSSSWSKLLNLIGGNGTAGGNLAGSLFGGSGGSGGLTGGLGSIAGGAFNMTPFLLALAQAKSQGDDIDGVLSQIDGSGYQKAVLDPYDLQTGIGRTALTDSLSQRGVLGSSFGNNDINNFNYMRDLGRGDLAAKSGLASAGLQGSLINQRNTNTNMLLGAGLNASGRLFSPQKDPFNLAALMGG